MILNKVKINGYKRLKNVCTDIDAKLLAIIGPNEAGKSSFFNALLSIEKNAAYTGQELTKLIKRNPSDIVLQVEYLLDKSEKEFIENINCQGEPRYFIVKKLVSGELIYSLSDDLSRKADLVDQLIELLDKFISLKTYQKFSKNNFTDDDESFFDISQSAIEELKLNNQEISSELLISFELLNQFYEQKLIYVNTPINRSLNKLSKIFENFIIDRKKTNPHNLVLDFCIDNRPNFILFNDENRFLKGNYPNTELQNPKKSIQNLFEVGGIKIKDYLDSINTRNEGKRAQLNDIVNRNLRKVFLKSWSQTKIYPRMTLDLNGVRLQIVSGDEDNYTEITERSDGLKQYISLRAFLALKSMKTKPILLIDEAELHLHYSAQSDLVSEFEKQDIVNSIIYSTHSAGCLPSDLGTGIRAIVQIKKDGIDTGVSEIKNSIWTNEGGFSPILFAMGANIIAFTMARKAVIAEGPSETILLPKIFKEISNQDYLDFQVAPGIASISPKEVSLFDFEASKVGYIVDGDNAGIKLKKKLEKNGVPSSKILILEDGCSIEDYIDTNILINAVNRELVKSGNGELNISSLPEKNRIKAIEKECKARGFNLPPKTKIARNIVYNSNKTKIIEKTKLKFLEKTYSNLKEILTN